MQWLENFGAGHLSYLDLAQISRCNPGIIYALRNTAVGTTVQWFESLTNQWTVDLNMSTVLISLTFHTDMCC
jgi:hypothetical protein